MPALADNYFWMLHEEVHAIVVDPGDAKPVFDALAGSTLQLAAILVTHRHAICAHNPFLRSREATVIAAVRQHGGLAADAGETAVFAALRQWKNDFR